MSAPPGNGISDQHAAALVASRGEAPFTTMEELWRRVGVPGAALERLAEADAFGGMGLARREALWAIRSVADTVLPLFEAADRRQAPEPEATEPAMALAPMIAGREVVEDYGSTGPSLRAHSVSFLREELRARGMVTCEDLAHTCDGRRVVVPGIVLMRQKPGSATSGMRHGRRVRRSTCRTPLHRPPSKCIHATSGEQYAGRRRSLGRERPSPRARPRSWSRRVDACR